MPKMANKVMIVGTGNVGASIAYSLLNQRSAVSELVLVDLDSEDALGEAMDLRNALAVAPAYLKITASTYAAARDCDVVVITAGAAQKPGETRLDLLKKNAAIMKSIVDPIMASGFSGIFLVITNPVDVLAQVVQEISGLPAERVIGSGTVLDSARLRGRIAGYLNVSPKSVHASIIGEHGDSEFAVWSLANVGGQPVTSLLSAGARADIETFVKNEAYEIIQKKGSTHYGIGSCAVQILNCILADERRVLPVSTFHDDVSAYYGFPVVLGRSGVLRPVALPLSESEAVLLQKSVNILKRARKSLA